MQGDLKAESNASPASPPHPACLQGDLQAESNGAVTACKPLTGLPLAPHPACLQGDLKAESNDVVITYLKSYERMGRARVECVSGCT